MEEEKEIMRKSWMVIYSLKKKIKKKLICDFKVPYKVYYACGQFLATYIKHD